jgi:hypothetical protein
MVPIPPCEAFMNSYVTVDLGATSGRVVVGRLERGRLEMNEVHRFRNEPFGSVGNSTGPPRSSLHRPSSVCNVLPLSWTVSLTASL